MGFWDWSMVINGFSCLSFGVLHVVIAGERKELAWFLCGWMVPGIVLPWHSCRWRWDGWVKREVVIGFYEFAVRWWRLVVVSVVSPLLWADVRV
ncbi:MAG: hypothetical protein R3C05_01940 [Pirellulaceae bacterium]